jgi:AcrR family transcriptional regulator
MKATATRAPENTRGKILQAAFNEFYKNGFQGGSLNRIVDEARTTKGALFHHFKDEALLLQTGQALFDYLDSLKP